MEEEERRKKEAIERQKEEEKRRLEEKQKKEEEEMQRKVEEQKREEQAEQESVKQEQLKNQKEQDDSDQIEKNIKTQTEISLQAARNSYLNRRNYYREQFRLKESCPKPTDIRFPKPLVYTRINYQNVGAAVSDDYEDVEIICIRRIYKLVMFRLILIFWLRINK